MQLVINYHEKVSTTSLLVAQKFGKEHKNVLRDIQNLACSPEFRALHFELSSYKSQQNKDLPMYIMDRDGFTMLMMYFTGDVATKFREEYIEEFNRMEKLLKAQTPVLIATYQKRLLSEPTRELPRGWWSVFDRSHFVMLWIEKHVGSVNEYDLVDGSIGIRWSTFRKEQSWKLPSSQFPYHHADKRGTVMACCYQNPEAQYFDDWLKDVYQPSYLYPYLHNKFSSDVTMIGRVEKAQRLLLKA